MSFSTDTNDSNTGIHYILIFVFLVLNTRVIKPSWQAHAFQMHWGKINTTTNTKLFWQIVSVTDVLVKPHKTVMIVSLARPVLFFKTHSQLFFSAQGDIAEQENPQVHTFLLQSCEEDDSDVLEYCDRLPAPEAQAVAYLNSLPRQLKENTDMYGTIISLLYSNFNCNVLLHFVFSITSVLFYSWLWFL